MTKKTTFTYDQMIEHNPKIAQFFKKEQWDAQQKSNVQVGELFVEEWREHLLENLDGLFQKHGTIKDKCWGQGYNRAVIGIGAGPSFNKNRDNLVELCGLDASMEAKTGDNAFIFIASNHQFKPCLKHGIIPHFVILCDGADTVYDQLCTDIPDKARGCILLCPLRASPKITKEWSKQGRSIMFWVGDNPSLIESFEKKMGYNPRDRGYVISPGGNVMNQVFLVGLTQFHSTVFMMVGNDLSYDYDPDLKKRRNTYYADGDYSTNLASGRDEAERCIPWMGYSLEESVLMEGEYLIKFEPRMTTGQLLLYKMWAENQIAVQEGWKRAIHYYNCTEGGILGVMSREGVPFFWDEKDSLYKLDKSKQTKMFLDKNNFYMMDEILPKRWHTRTLEKAVGEFLFARKKYFDRYRETGVIIPAYGQSTQMQMQ